MEIDGEELRVHTNKCEGLNAHLKHKLKRIRGTSRRYVEGYLAEAVFRQNSRAMKESPFEAFLDMISEPIDFHEDDESDGEDSNWSVVWSEGEDPVELDFGEAEG